MIAITAFSFKGNFWLLPRYQFLISNFKTNPKFQCPNQKFEKCDAAAKLDKNYWKCYNVYNYKNMEVMKVYDPKICQKALDAQRGHALSAIASDDNPSGNAYMGRIPLCDCPDCEPGAWPANIQDQLDEFTENNGPGTVPADE